MNVLAAITIAVATVTILLMDWVPHPAQPEHRIQYRPGTAARVL